MARSTQQEIDARAKVMKDRKQAILDEQEAQRLADIAQRKAMRTLRYEKRRDFGTVADDEGLFVIGETTITFLIEEPLLRVALRLLGRLAQTPGELEALVAQYAEEGTQGHEDMRASENGHRLIVEGSLSGKIYS